MVSEKRSLVASRWSLVKTVYLGLGSNLGDKRKNIKEAIKLLRREVKVIKVSLLYKTKPVGYADQPDFINAVAEIKTNLTPLRLLRLAKDIEKKMGREKNFRNGPRLIDIDILLFEGKTIKTSQLVIPHPQMCRRSFVLDPLREIAPALDRKIFKWKK